MKLLPPPGNEIFPTNYRIPDQSGERVRVCASECECARVCCVCVRVHLSYVELLLVSRKSQG